jgi:hypothetical protein
MAFAALVLTYKPDTRCVIVQVHVLLYPRDSQYLPIFFSSPHLSTTPMTFPTFTDVTQHLTRFSARAVVFTSIQGWAYNEAKRRMVENGQWEQIKYRPSEESTIPASQ